MSLDGLQKSGLQQDRWTLELYPKTELALPASGNLAELQADFWLFTPACLYLWAGFTDRTWHDIARRLHLNYPLRFIYRRTAPWFRGLQLLDGDASWNHGLFAVPLAFKEAVRRDVCSFSSWDPSRRRMCLAGVRELVIGPAEFPATIDAFVCAATDGTWLIASADPGEEAQPREVVRLPPDSQAVTAAHTLALDPTKDGLVAELVEKPELLYAGPPKPTPQTHHDLGSVPIPSWLALNGKAARRNLERDRRG